MPTVEELRVQITADVGDFQRSIAGFRKDVRDAADSTEEIARAAGGVSSSLDGARGAAGQAGSTFQSFSGFAEGVSLSLNDVREAIRNADRAFATADTDELRSQLTQLRGQFEAVEADMLSAAGATKTLSRGGGQASATLIELSRGASDARFGFAGLANNLEQAVNNFGNLTRASGGVGGALRALGSSLLGPTGVVVGISTLIAYGPQIVGFFRNMTGGAVQSAAGVETLGDAIKGLVDFQVGQTIAPFESSDAARLEAGRLRESIAELEREQRRYYETVTITTPALNALGSQQEQQTQTIQRVKAGYAGQVAEIKNTIAAERAALAAVEEGTKALETQERVLQVFRDRIEQAAAAVPGLTVGVNASGAAAEEAARQYRTFAEAAQQALAVIREGRGDLLPGRLGGARAPDTPGGEGAGQIRDLPAIINDVRDQTVSLGEQLDLTFQVAAAEGVGLFVGGLGDALGQLVSLQSTFGEFFRSVVRGFQQIIAQIVAAIAKAVIFRGLLALTGPGGFFGSIVSGLAGAGRAAPLAASPAAAVSVGFSQPRLTLSGDMVLDMAVAADDRRMARGRPSLLGR